MDKIIKSLRDSGMARWTVLLCLSIPMFGSYFFADIFSPLSEIFKTPENVALGWSASDYGIYTGAYSILCVFGGLIVCGMLLDKWGIRITGSIFVTIMIAGAAMVIYAMSENFEGGNIAMFLTRITDKPSLAVATAGCALFGLGSEIAGVAVNRAIAKWYKDKEMALAMGVQLALARLGKATALISVPYIISMENGMLTFGEIAKICFIGLTLLIIGGIVWCCFVGFDYRLDRQQSFVKKTAKQAEDDFRWGDVVKVLGNRYFLLIALLCVCFYGCIISFAKFATAVAIPRFGIDYRTAGQMISMIPFCTIVFAPLFGFIVDRFGNGTRFMVLGAVLVLIAHLTIAFAPGEAIFGYIGIGILGIGYSLVPAAMWPSVPKVIPEKVLGTAYSLIYWIQNIGLLAIPVIVGSILDKTDKVGASATATQTELLFIGLAAASIAISIILRKESVKNPQLELDKKRL